MAVDDVVKGAGGVVFHHGEEAFTQYRNRWDSLSERSPSPFLTHGWLLAWWRAYGHGTLVTAALHGGDGALRAAATLQQAPLGGLTATANDHSGDWDAVAEDDAAREELWDAVAGLDVRYVTLRHLRAGRGSERAARRALGRAGFRIHATPGNRSPYVDLPGSYDDLLAGYSRNFRSQLGRRRRQLEREGEVTFRVTTGGPTTDADLDALFRVEASGWKAREGSAILRDARSQRLYRDFAHAMAAQGALRLYLLELDGTAVAGDLGCAIGDTGFLVKTGFDEAWGKLSPGLVLRGDVLQASIEEGLRGYDFLGPADPYKLRWTDTVRPRATLRGFRGAALPAATWHGALRPALKRARAALAERRAARGRSAPAATP
jgi:CelD/BcsL family acetyltransferase involved in cellulose biosynthesis